MNNINHEINCEWGLQGINKFKEQTDVFIIVDVLSFSTAVDIAVSNGAVIFPYKYKDETSVLYSKQVNADLASFTRTKNSFSLSPVSLLEISDGTRLVLPSPNGAEVSLSAMPVTVVCACFRNCKSAAEYAGTLGKNITVIPAGERWHDGSIRFALEDLLGAGAVISYLKGNCSPESTAASELFRHHHFNLFSTLLSTPSGIELYEKGFEEDVALASELNVSHCVPVLNNGAFYNAAE
jgi:2-phosphosulfolactate phosphatase